MNRWSCIHLNRTFVHFDVCIRFFLILYLSLPIRSRVLAPSLWTKKVYILIAPVVMLVLEEISPSEVLRQALLQDVSFHRHFHPDLVEHIVLSIV